MKYTVKINVHDHLRRGSSTRASLDVEADTEKDAVELALARAAVLWPQGKFKAYDWFPDRIALFEAQQQVEDVSREIAPHLSLKRGPGRPRKEVGL